MSMISEDQKDGPNSQIPILPLVPPPHPVTFRDHIRDFVDRRRRPVRDPDFGARAGVAMQERLEEIAAYRAAVVPVDEVERKEQDVLPHRRPPLRHVPPVVRLPDPQYEDVLLPAPGNGAPAPAHERDPLECSCCREPVPVDVMPCCQMMICDACVVQWRGSCPGCRNRRLYHQHVRDVVRRQQPVAPVILPPQPPVVPVVPALPPIVAVDAPAAPPQQYVDPMIARLQQMRNNIRANRVPVAPVLDAQEWRDFWGGRVYAPRDRNVMRVEGHVGHGIIEYHDRRDIVTRMRSYPFPYLNFIGIWNGSEFGGMDEAYVNHFGLHFHENFVEIELPCSIVDELMGWWAHRPRDQENANFRISVARCKRLLQELDITSEQLYFASLYAPVIAQITSWDRQQNVARVQRGSYWDFSGIRSSIKKICESIDTTRSGALIFSLSTITTIVSAVYITRKLRILPFLRMLWRAAGSVEKGAHWAIELTQGVAPIGGRGLMQFGFVRRLMVVWSWCAYYVYAFLMRQTGHAFVHIIPPPPRLVGIELNPGPAVYKHVLLRRLINCVRLPRVEPRRFSSMRLTDPYREHLLSKEMDTRRGIQAQIAFGVRGYVPTAYASNAHNEQMALIARCMAKTPEPTALLDECIAWCKLHHRIFFNKMFNVKSVPFSEYIKRTGCSPSVKAQLIKCKQRLDDLGITESSNLSAAQLHEWTTRKSFVKMENANYDSPMGRKDKAPRMIQGGAEEFIVLVGPWIMALQDLFKRRWNKKNGVMMFTSGVSAEDCAEFITELDGNLLEDDIGKFDASVDEKWCQYEHWLCKKFGAPKAVLQLVWANINTHGITQHGWRYKRKGMRKSGDPYTSIFNSIINGMAHMFLYCRFTGRHPKFIRGFIRMLLQGDDNALCHKERQKFPWVPFMAELGFEAEALYRDTPELLEFCSMRLYMTGEGWVFGPKPGRVLAKLGFVVNPPVNVDLKSLLKGIVLGLRVTAHYIPPLRAVIDRVLELTEDVKELSKGQMHKFDKWQQHKMTSKMRHTEGETMVTLNMVYDWDYVDQANLERDLRNMQLGDEWPTPLVELLMDRDVSAPQQHVAA